jgi:hypothetical protein
MSLFAKRLAALGGPSVAPKPSVVPPRVSDLIRSTPVGVAPSTAPFVFFGGVISFFFYLSLMAFFVFLILVLVHFTIKPIFKFDVNEQGLVDISPSSGEVVWKNNLADADAKADFKNALNCNYTISMDIFVKSGIPLTSTPRVLLYRSDAPVAFQEDKLASDLFTLYPDTNLLVYLDPVKNDLNVVAVTMDSTNAVHPEAIPAIPNVPLEQPFRITIVFQPTMMEVYMNGQLQATRVFSGRPKETTGGFLAPSEFVRQTARVGNLQYWPRTLGPSEIRGSGPAIPGADFFVVKV